MFRRSNFKRPINSVKNILDATALTVSAGVITTVDLMTVVNDYAGGAIEVPVGAVVRGVYLFFQIQPQTLKVAIEAYVAKVPPGLTLPVPGATGGDSGRRFILHEEKGIPGPSNNGSPPSTFRGYVKLPRGRQRVGESDRLVLRVSSAGAYDMCAKAIYKWYS